ncbi:thiamine-phosphate kinase [bacterium]|nr:thiamine-phosphate kinase [bacterium]
MKEQDLLKLIQAISHKTGAQLVGDDAAVLKDLVISTDQFVENVHFRWDFHKNPEQVGFKGVVQALSDLAAMAAHPAGLLVSAALPLDQKEKWPQIFGGIEDACLHYKIPLLGGDLTRSPQGTYLDFVVLGFQSKPVLKSGAKPGDLLAVSGPIGSAAGGLLSLQNNWNFPLLQKAFLQPHAQIQTALELHQLNAMTSLTDISDSLSKSLLDLSFHSDCGFELEIQKIPFDNELKKMCDERSLSLTDFLLGGGEDYQLLMTLPMNSSAKLISDHGLTVIGRAKKEKENFYTIDEKKYPVTEVGWDPFHL